MRLAILMGDKNMPRRYPGLSVALLALAVSGCSGSFPFGNKNDASASPSASAQPLVGTPVGSAAPSAAAATPAAGGPAFSFGDDASRFSKDGECDDKRFTGPGMTNTPLLDSDIQHDATDCRAAYSQGRLSLRE